MPEARRELVVNLPKDVVVKVLSDMKIVGQCFSFVKSVSDDGYTWYVKAPMSVITQTKALRVRTISEEPFEWEARGDHLLWKGRFEVSVNENETIIHIHLSVSGLGSIAPVINQMAGVQIEGQLRHFIKELKSILSPKEWRIRKG